MIHEKVSTNLDFVERELKIQKFWKDNSIFEKSVDLRKERPVFTFYDGPPTANGRPHIGHVLTRAVKDLIPRYKTMKGYHVVRKAGWDTHGLPVELEVEKELGISGKPDIEKYGVEPFIKKCKESVWKYESEWREMSDRVGFWADMDSPYVTYHNEYIESVWWALKKIWDKGLLYKGHKVVPYCPRCGTPLSSHEVALGYKDVKEESIYVKFKLKDKDNEYFLAWTTTPWTLPSNVALVVNANETYARVKSNGQIFIMAEALVEAVLGEGTETLKTMKGSELERIKYEPLFDFVPAEMLETGFYICCDDYVTLTDGTGIVHTAPAFGEDDSRVGKIYGLPFLQLVDEQGNFNETVNLWKSLFVKEADPKIISHLEQTGQLLKASSYEHSYPFCWRCDSPLLYYARNTWFIKMTELRSNLAANNNTVNWLPDNVKQGRFGNFLENVIDWGLSRERYWGTPLPIWECDCGHKHLIGSVEELSSMSDGLPQDMELHKPYIDQIFLNCPKCGGKMKRVPEVIDCWFDSGSMPFAQWHYPFENADLFNKQFPADFISEAVDQTRGWFYTLMAISTLIFEKAPFRNCIVLGHVQDKFGLKMSKHKGNVVDPWTVLNKQGADAVRWYFFINSAPWLPNRFSEEAVSETERRFMGTLWNTYAFYVLYANIDGFDWNKYELEKEKLTVMDRWILSKLQTLIAFVDDSLSQYKLTEPARALDDFVDNLSNWYVRRCRQRFWGNGIDQDKINAYMTLHTVLVTLSKLSAPFIPFMAEEIYRNLVFYTNSSVPESVHFTDFPEADMDLVDKNLESGMDLVLNMVALGRVARNSANVKNRQPINTMYVLSEKSLDPMYMEIVTDELNVKRVEYVNDASRFTTYKFKPQLKTLGPRYGKLLPKINEYLQNGDGNSFMDSLHREGKICFELEGVQVVLNDDDVLTEVLQKEGFMSASNDGITIVLDTLLTPELVEEGYVRELISKLQTMRKKAGFDVLDKINVYYKGSDIISGVFERNKETISTDVLADNISEGENGYLTEWNVNGENVTLSIEKNI